MRAACVGEPLVAVTVITFVWPTSVTETPGAPPICWLTAARTGALVTS